MATIIKKYKKKESVVILHQGRFIPQIRSRHPSHAGIRRTLQALPFRSIIRMGSTTAVNNVPRVTLNSIDAIGNSSSKLRMKQCFNRENVKTAEWGTGQYARINENGIYYVQHDGENLIIEYPIVAKSNFGSRGQGNTLLKTQIDLERWLVGKNLNNYIFEKYYNFNKEYRLHVTEDGCFYSCRKMLKQEFREHPNAWQRHDDNCVWILPENENFDKPNNWNEIVEHCVKALKSCGLDFGACDLRVQNNKNAEGERRDNPDFIVVEINSAPSFGEVTLEKYKEVLPQLLVKKARKEGLYNE